jgi:hypothetical protein
MVRIEERNSVRVCNACSDVNFKVVEEDAGGGECPSDHGSELEYGVTWRARLQG